jgi:ubiquinone/menaquinone biosynthesis C-methylase UbiE
MPAIPDITLIVTFPDGDSMQIHLTEERGYEDLDGRAHLPMYSKFVTEVFPTLEEELKTSGKHILDCACGSGYGSYFVSSSLRRPVIGIDIDATVIRYALKRYSILCSDLRFNAGNAMRLDMLPSSSICSILSIETIEHVSDPDSALREFCRVLDRRGVLYITTPDRTRHPDSLTSHFHVREFMPRDFERFLHKYFVSVELETDSYQIVAICRNPLEKMRA